MECGGLNVLRNMEWSSQNIVESSDDSESKSLLQEVDVVSDEASEQNYDIASEDGAEETSLGYQEYKPSTISTRREFTVSGEHLQKEHLGEDASLAGENIEIAERTEKNREDGSINSEQESFPDEGDIQEDMSINGDRFQKANSEACQEMPLDDDDVSSDVFLDAEHPTEMNSEAARFVSEKSYQSRTEDDPKDKALRYLEESGVIRLFQVSSSSQCSL